MKGTIPRNTDETRHVSNCFDSTYATRNRGLFMLGVSTGGRISELLSLTIGEVYQNGAAGTTSPVYAITRKQPQRSSKSDRSGKKERPYDTTIPNAISIYDPKRNP